jgi:hypothetical protein
MYVVDYTLNFAHSLTVATFMGQGAAAFYDGSTAEYITEAPGGTAGGYYDLRKATPRQHVFPVCRRQHDNPDRRFPVMAH